MTGRARHRWWIVVVVLAMATFFVVPEAAAQGADRQVTFIGSGWGHGVGMSQYGTFQRSLEGQTHSQILGDYYQGSTIGTLGSGGVADVDEVFVSVASDQITSRATVLAGPGGASDGVTVKRGQSETIALQPGDWVQITDTTETSGGCDVTFDEGPGWGIGSCNVTVELAAGSAPPPYLVRLDSCRGGNCTFGWGSEVVFRDNAGHDGAFPGFDVVVRVGIDDYVRGIAEVPYSWPAEALKTQAIAARSYAASRAVAVTHSSEPCYCDLRNDSFDQVYAGWVGSWPMNAQWDAAATSTNGKVVAHTDAPDGLIVRTYYSSSNGGASESSQDKWGGVHSYLTSIPDPWSLTAANPYASWTETRTVAALASWLGVADVAGVRVTARNASGTPKTFVFTGVTASGSLQEITKTVEQVRSKFGLRSWYFTVSLDTARVGVHDHTTGIWHLRTATGVSSFYYGNPKDKPYVGDWDGDGEVTVGLYRQSTGFLFLRNSNTQGIADIQIYYGNPGDVPIAGDWDGDGVDTVGIFRPSEARFYLRNTNTQGTGDVSFAFGERGDVPIAGDWNGDGVDTVGLYRPSNQTVYLANSNTNPKADITWAYGGAAAGDRVIAGDWNGDGTDSVGLFRPGEAMFYLRDTYTQPAANIVFEMGESFMTPVAGW